MSKPVIIVVPGAWHVPAHFSLTQAELEAAGYTVIGVELPGNDFNSKATIDDDTTAVRQVVNSQLDEGSDVVLVCHSYGSIPCAASTSGLDVQTRKAAGYSSGVRAIVILAGFLLPAGTSMFAIMGNKLPPQYLHDLESGTTLPFSPPGATYILYNDLGPVEAEKAIWKLKPQSFAINTSITPDQFGALQGICVSFLLCSKDNAAPFEVQKQTVAGCRAAGLETYAEVAESGHSPFVKVPKETARFIRRAAGEELETGFAKYEG